MSNGSPAAGTSPLADNPPRICSARGCRASAIWALHWNNPRLHTAQRRKTWLACAEHRQSLGDFLGARGFLREVTPAEGSPTLDT